METRGVMKKLVDLTIASFIRISRGGTLANIAARVARKICREELSNRIIDDQLDEGTRENANSIFKNCIDRRVEEQLAI